VVKLTDKEVRYMEGIAEITIPEIEGLEETFAKKTTNCPDIGGGPDH